MIVRNALGDYEAVDKRKVKGLVERQPDDTDLQWTDDEHGSETRVYILDEHEYLSIGPKEKHRLVGPGFTYTTTDPQSGFRWGEWHVNDPRAWAWVRRLIAEAHITKENLVGPLEERFVEVK